MEWLNRFGLVCVVVILIPNLWFAIQHKGEFANRWNHKAVIVMEQIGRMGCMGFMIFQIPGTCLGCWSLEACRVYWMTDTILCALYCVFWWVFRKHHTVLRALVLSGLPAVLFLFSGIMLRSIPLVVSAVLFAPAHIAISYKNATYGR